MKVSGSTMATPLTDPSPGMAPMKRPAVTPMKTIIRFSGDSDVAKPSARWCKQFHCSAPSEKDGVEREEERLGQAFRQQDLQRHFEEEEQKHRCADVSIAVSSPAVSAENLEIPEQEQRQGDIGPEPRRSARW